MDGWIENKQEKEAQSDEKKKPSRKLLHAPLFALQIFGLWAPENMRGNKTKRTLYSCYSAFVVSCISLFFSASASNLTHSTHDLVEFTDSLLISLVTVNTFSKIHALLFRRDRVISAMSTLDELVLTWGLVAHSQPSKEERDSALQVWQRRFKYITIFILFNVVCAFYAWSLSPLFSNSESGLNLPFAAWFPFDTHSDHRGYWVAFGIQITFGIFDALCSLTMDCFFLGCLLYSLLCIHALQPSLRDIREDNTNVGEERLMDVIRRHQMVLRLIAELSDIIGPFMFIHSLAMSLLICSTMMHLTMIGWNAKVFGVTIFATMEMSELFIFCWFGSEIQIKSEQCGSDIYSCEWFDTQPSVKTSLRIVMMRAQKPAVIRGFGYTTLSLQLFTSLMRLSYSFYALLRQMDG